MTDDIVKRLRGPRTEQGGLWPIPNLHEEAADEIEKLREARDASRMEVIDVVRENEKLRAALRESDAQFMRVDKERMELRAECKWRPMNTAPRDGTLVLAAVAVFSAKDKSFLHWDIAAVAHDNGNAITTGGDDVGWSWDDFEFWKPIPIPSAKAAYGESDEVDRSA